MEHFSGVAGDQGITEKEIGTVLSIVMAVSAGRVRAQFRDTGRKGKQRKQSRAKQKPTGR